MTESIPPEALQRLIAGYVLYDLSPEEAAALEEAAANDPAIAHEIEQLQRTLELTYAPPEVAPPTYLKAAILKAHQTAQSEDTAATSIPAPPISLTTARSKRRRWVTALGAIAAVAIAGLGVSNYVLWRSLQATRAQLQQSSAETFTVSLEPTEADLKASVRVTVNPATLQASLNAENLPPLPAGEVYALWTVLQPEAPFTTDEKGAILTEVFTVDETQGVQIKTIALPQVYREQQWVAAIAITIEAAAAPQRHQADPILIQKL